MDMSEPRDLREPLEARDFNGTSAGSLGVESFMDLLALRASREVSGSSVASTVASDILEFMRLILSFTDIVLQSLNVDKSCSCYSMPTGSAEIALVKGNTRLSGDLHSAEMLKFR